MPCEAGAIGLRGASPFAVTVASSTFTSNWVNGSSNALGGGLWVHVTLRSLTVKNSTFTSNSVGLMRSDGVKCGGAAIMATNTRTFITSSTFTKQLARSAASSTTTALGAIYVASAGILTLRRVTVTDNSGFCTAVSCSKNVPPGQRLKTGGLADG